MDLYKRLASASNFLQQHSSSSTPTTPDQPHKVTRRTSPFMQYFHGGCCKLCGREFRGLKASNGKRHLEMKHPVEYQQVLEHKRRTGQLYKGRKSLSTVCSSTDEDDGQSRFLGLNNAIVNGSPPLLIDPNQNKCFDVEEEEEEGGDDGNAESGDVVPQQIASIPDQIDQEEDQMDVATAASSQSPSNIDFHAQFTECMVALEAAARPLRRLALFAGTAGLGGSAMENKHFKELLKSIPHLPIPTANELEQQVNLEISDILLRIHRLLNSLPCGFCVSADVVKNCDNDPQTSSSHSMGIIAHFWNPIESRVEAAALDIIQLNEHPSLEFVAETLRHAFDKTDLNPMMIYRTIVESSSSFDQNKSSIPQNFNSSTLKFQERNYSSFYVGSCASYRLRLTLDDVLSNDREAVKLREKITQILSHFCHKDSNEKFLKLKSQIGRIHLPSSLNWHSWKPLYKQLVENFQIFNQFCSSQSLPTLSQKDQQTLVGLLQLDKPVELFARKLEEEGTPTCSLLFPGLKLLLEELKGTQSNLSHLLRTALSSRFVDVLTSIDENADPFYVAATFLDPTVAPLMKGYEDKAEKAIQIVCSRLLSKNSTQMLINKGFCWKENGSSNRPLQQQKDPISEFPSNLNKSKGFCWNKRVENSPRPFNNSNSIFGFDCGGKIGAVGKIILPDELKKEIRMYLIKYFHQHCSPANSPQSTTTPQHQNAFQFWSQKAQQWPSLSLLAASILAVPATSASARNLLANLNNAGDKQLWKKALLTFNDHYVSI